MKTKNILTAALLGIFALTACKKDSTPISTGELEIKFNTSLYSFTKATDTAFEENDAIGVNIYKGDDSYIHNAKFTHNGTGLTSTQQYFWYQDTEVEASIVAYYPYAEIAENSADYTFAVKNDQSDIANYKASDLMIAVAESKPTENAVTLPFKHALSKVIITVDNEITDDAITGVALKGVKTNVSVDLKTTELTADTEGTVKAYKNADNSWQLIIAPQTATPQLVVTTASEKEYTFSLDRSTTFSAGKYSTASITVTASTPDSEQKLDVSFNTNIENWVEDNTLQFTQQEGNEGGNEEGNEEGNEGEESKEVRIYLSDDWGWTYLWCWDINGAQIFDGAEWPGTEKHGEVDGYYYWVVPEAYVGQTVSLLFAKKTDTEEEQSPDYTNLTLSEDHYFHLEWTQETGVQVILER